MIAVVLCRLQEEKPVVVMVLLTMVNVLLAMRITRNASAWNAVDVGMLTECRGSGVRTLLDV